jgi:hypothetical protein
MPAATAEPKQLRGLHIELKVKQPTPAPAPKARGQSQRDCVHQPRVARNELPWVRAEKIINPNGVVSSVVNRERKRIGRNPVGVGEFSGR